VQRREQVRVVVAEIDGTEACQGIEVVDTALVGDVAPRAARTHRCLASAPPPRYEVELRSLLAMIEATAGDHDAADVCLYRAQRLAGQTSLAISEALVANACGYASLRREQLGAARAAFNLKVDLHACSGNPFGPPFSLWGLGHVELAEGNLDAARHLHLRAAHAAMELGDGDAVARTLAGLTATCTSLELATTGARLLGAATIRRGHMGAPRPIIAHDEALPTERACGNDSTPISSRRNRRSGPR
jgi:hypothetical protein